jgi:hypothetical protein
MSINNKDLIISKLLRQDVQKFRSLFPHVSAAIQSRKYPLKGDTIEQLTAMFRKDEVKSGMKN